MCGGPLGKKCMQLSLFALTYSAFGIVVVLLFTFTKPAVGVCESADGAVMLLWNYCECAGSPCEGFVHVSGLWTVSLALFIIGTIVLAVTVAVHALLHTKPHAGAPGAALRFGAFGYAASWLLLLLSAILHRKTVREHAADEMKAITVVWWPFHALVVADCAILLLSCLSFLRYNFFADYYEQVEGRDLCCSPYHRIPQE